MQSGESSEKPGWNADDMEKWRKKQSTINNNAIDEKATITML